MRMLKLGAYEYVNPEQIVAVYRDRVTNKPVIKTTKGDITVFELAFDQLMKAIDSL